MLLGTYLPHNGSYILIQPIAGCVTVTDRAQDSSRSCEIDETKLAACLTCRRLRILWVSVSTVASSCGSPSPDTRQISRKLDASGSRKVVADSSSMRGIACLMASRMSACCLGVGKGSLARIPVSRHKSAAGCLFTTFTISNIRPAHSRPTSLPKRKHATSWVSDNASIPSIGLKLSLVQSTLSRPTGALSKLAYKGRVR
jgi:hypothetical protein